MKRIILIEDDPGILDALTVMLKRDGFEVDAYCDAKLILKTNFTLPTVFLIDKQLTGVDGLDLCRFLKATAATVNIPVIIFSASPSVEKMAYLAGADAFIEKPFTNNTLRLVLQTFTSNA